MSLRQKRYKAVIGRGLLLAGYLFLFADQFKGQYFEIANFFDYSVHHVAANARLAGHGLTEEVGMNMLEVNARKAIECYPSKLQKKTERPAHLGIDKRFHFKRAIRVPQIRAPGRSLCIVLKARDFSAVPECVSSELPTNSLRGPPSA